MIIFTIISCITLFLVRRYASAEVMTSDEPELDADALQHIGRVVTVEQAIADGCGKVRVGETVWNALGSDAPQGARVKVTGIDGDCLVVDRAVD